MKKPHSLLLVAVALTALYAIRHFPQKALPPTTEKEENTAVIEPVIATPVLARSTTPTTVLADPRVMAPSASPLPDNDQPRPIPPTVHTVIHDAATFRWGDFQNVVNEKGIRLTGADSSDPNGLKGVFLSEVVQPNGQFQEVIFDYHAEIAEGSELVFEVRTLSNETWSGWGEIQRSDLKQPLALEKPASAWQYRFTFSSRNPASSPHLHSVTVTTYPTDATANAVSQNNSSQEPELIP